MMQGWLQKLDTFVLKFIWLLMILVHISEPEHIHVQFEV